MTGLAGRNGTNLYRRATAPPPLPAGGRAVFRHRRSSAEARARQLGGSSKSCSQQQHTTLSRSTFVDLHQDEQKCGQMALPAWRRYRWLPPTLLPRPPEAFLTMTSLQLSSKTHGSMTTVFLLYFALLFSSVSGNPDAPHITAIAGDTITLNCDVNFPNGVASPYVVQWWRKGAEVPFYIWYDDYPEYASQEYKGRVSKVSPA